MREISSQQLCEVSGGDDNHSQGTMGFIYGTGLFDASKFIKGLMEGKNGEVGAGIGSHIATGKGYVELTQREFINLLFEAKDSIIVQTSNKLNITF